MYKKIQGKSGVRYIKDGRMVAKKDIPIEELEKMDGIQRLNEKQCLFCGAPAEHRRLVNLQMVDLCNDHYYSENIGSIAAKLKE